MTNKRKNEIREKGLKLIEGVQHLFDMRTGKGSTSVMKNAWNIVAVRLYDFNKCLVNTEPEVATKGESQTEQSQEELLEELAKLIYKMWDGRPEERATVYNEIMSKFHLSSKSAGSPDLEKFHDLEKKYRNEE